MFIDETEICKDFRKQKFSWTNEENRRYSYNDGDFVFLPTRVDKFSSLSRPLPACRQILCLQAELPSPRAAFYFLRVECGEQRQAVLAE